MYILGFDIPMAELLLVMFIVLLALLIIIIISLFRSSRKEKEIKDLSIELKKIKKEELEELENIKRLSQGKKIVKKKIAEKPAEELKKSWRDKINQILQEKKQYYQQKKLEADKQRKQKKAEEELSRIVNRKTGKVLMGVKEGFVDQGKEIKKEVLEGRDYTTSQLKKGMLRARKLEKKTSNQAIKELGKTLGVIAEEAKKPSIGLQTGIIGSKGGVMGRIKEVEKEIDREIKELKKDERILRRELARVAKEDSKETQKKVRMLSGKIYDELEIIGKKEERTRKKLVIGDEKELIKARTKFYKNQGKTKRELSQITNRIEQQLKPKTKEKQIRPKLIYITPSQAKVRSMKPEKRRSEVYNMLREQGINTTPRKDEPKAVLLDRNQKVLKAPQPNVVEEIVGKKIKINDDKEAMLNKLKGAYY